MLVGTRRTGSQALAALSAQQGQPGAAGLAVGETRTGGTGWLAGCGGKILTVSRFKYSFPPRIWAFFVVTGQTACHSLADSQWKAKHIHKLGADFELCWLRCSLTVEGDWWSQRKPKACFNPSVAHILSKHPKNWNKLNVNQLVALQIFSRGNHSIGIKVAANFPPETRQIYLLNFSVMAVHHGRSMLLLTYDNTHLSVLSAALCVIHF